MLSYTIRVTESNRAIYFRRDTYTSQGPRKIIFKEERVIVPIPVASAPMYDSLIDQNPEVTHDDPVDQEVQETLDVNIDDGDTF